MLYADGAGIVSRPRNSLAKVMTDIVAVCGSFGLTVSEAKTETMCLMTKRMDRVTFNTETAGQAYKKPATFVYLGRTMCENANLAAEINRRMLLANLLFRRYDLSPDGQPIAPLWLQVQMLEGGVVEIMLYGCVTWSPTVTHLAILRTVHRRFLLRCIGWNRKPCDGSHMFPYADALAKTGCENVETALRKRTIRFAGFAALMGDERLPKRVVFGELKRGGWVASNATCHSLTCPSKRSNGRWKRRNRA